MFSAQAKMEWSYLEYKFVLVRRWSYYATYDIGDGESPRTVESNKSNMRFQISAQNRSCHGGEQPWRDPQVLAWVGEDIIAWVGEDSSETKKHVTRNEMWI